MKVAILMTAYNGGNYLEEQLNSIRNQTFADWELYIHDDCSTDTTSSILHRYASLDARIHLTDDGVRRGARDGFMWLLEQVTDADYWMFADHDDVWLPEKMQHSLDAMLRCDERDERPLIVCTDLCVVDAALNVIHPSLWRTHNVNQRTLNDKRCHLFYDNVTGCTMLLNAQARKVSLPCPPEAIMHDSWIAAAVLWNEGKVIPVNEPLILYRQHSANVVGLHKRPTLAAQLKRRKSLREKTDQQYRASQSLTHLSRFTFLLLKTYYSLLIRLHLR